MADLPKIVNLQTAIRSVTWTNRTITWEEERANIFNEKKIDIMIEYREDGTAKYKEIRNISTIFI